MKFKAKMLGTVTHTSQYCTCLATWGDIIQIKMILIVACRQR